MKWIKPLYFNNRIFQALGIIVFLAILGYSFDFSETVARLLLFGLLAILVIDIVLLFRVKKGISGGRLAPEKFSNGDENPIKLSFQNFYQFEVKLSIIDEVPPQFQMREANFKLT
ncbi:MAG: hypothetical protein ACJAXX_000941, partial [Roseivirga sp.]